MKRGDIIYARIIVADKLLDVELTCTVSSGIKKDWSTGESVSIILIMLYTTYKTNTSLTYYLYYMHHTHRYTANSLVTEC